ncbi:MAG TPA: hypothetical protein DD670_09890 [Planctomycetaceae bacterium]|nr:hypothetical protein [Planctomycetaceae bacterium]
MTTEQTDTKSEQIETINLKDPIFAAFLAWLIPGLGHLYQGRFAKAILFFVCIMSTFVYGLYLGGDSSVGWGRVVYASWRPEDRRLYYLCQIGVGLPALPALVQAVRVRGGKEPFGLFMAPPPLVEGDDPDRGPTVDAIHRRLARYFQLGEIYTSVAGLLNVLAMLDAWAGPVAPVKREDEEEEKAKDRKTSGDWSETDTTRKDA